MSSTPKKPPSNGAVGGTPTTATKRPAASSSTAGNISTTSNASSLNRTRSTRTTNTTTTPLSARAAAPSRKPATTESSDADDARAEMQARLEELQQLLTNSESALANSQKHAQLLQTQLDESLKDQSLLEETIQTHVERIDAQDADKREWTKAKRELEQTLESEREASNRERDEAQTREGEMQRSVVRLKEALSQQRSASLTVGDDDHTERRHSRPLSISRNSSFRSGGASPAPADAQFAPPSSSSSLTRSDSRSNARLVNEKDRIIEALKLDLAESQIKLVELENKDGNGLQALEAQMYNVKMQNARLMEENESFQLLLRDKTLNGDFALSSMRAPSTGDGEGSRPSSRHPHATNLEDELAGQDSESATSPDDIVVPDSREKRLQAEVNSMKEQNKALTLYINNIISRLLQHEQFEQILDKSPELLAGAAAAGQRSNLDTEKDLPPPPPPHKDTPPPSSQSEDSQQQAPSLLSRAGSVLRARAARPMSQLLSATSTTPEATSADAGHTVHENPTTAPRIPLGRSASTRATGGHRRGNSDWNASSTAAANVVSNMYKGPSPGLQSSAITSPGLGSPPGAARGSFFPAPRLPSASSIPVGTINESDSNGIDDENTAPTAQRNRSSDPPRGRPSTDAAALAALTGSSDVSNPSSPPRSTTSSGGATAADREGARPSGGAIMMGSKVRPLRLVQEAAPDKAAGNRASWFGWMNKGTAGVGGFMGVKGSGEGEGQQQGQ